MLNCFGIVSDIVIKLMSQRPCLITGYILQEHQSGLKTGCVVGLGLKTEGVVGCDLKTGGVMGPKNSTYGCA